MKKISIVIPSFNEEKNISVFYNAIKDIFVNKNYQFELVFVDDGSSDETFKEINNLPNDEALIKIISFSRNFGKEAAMYAGLQNATGDYVAIIDADLQQEPKLILDMLSILENNKNYDSVCCYQRKRKENKLVIKLKNYFYTIINASADTKFVKNASDFRLFDRQVVDAILLLSEKNRFSKGIFSWVGFNTYYMPYDVKKRLYGTSKWSLLKLFKYAFDGIESFSSLPIKLITISGIILTIPSLLALVIMLIASIFTDINLIRCLIDLVILIGGVILIAIGIVGDYIIKIFNEVKDRPIYIAKDIIVKDIKNDK